MIRYFLQRFLISMTICMIVSSCQNQEENVSDKQYAIQMLNNREFAQATSVLERLHKENPKDYEITLLLASSYSGSVGLNMIDAFGVFNALVFNKNKSSNAFKDDSGLSSQVEEFSEGDFNNNKKIAKIIVAYLEKLSDGFTVFFSVPYTKSQFRNRFVEAIVLTNEVPEESEYYLMAKNFATLLNVVQAMNYAKDAFPGLTEQDSWTTMELICAFQPDLFVRSFVSSFQYISSGVQEARIAAKLSERDISTKLNGLIKAANKINLLYNNHDGDILAGDLIFQTTKSNFCD